MGLEPSGPDWVGVVFGRGKLLGPPLVGEEITSAAIGHQLEELTQDCTCSKPLSAMGVDLPMCWNSRFDAVVPELSGPAAQSAAEEAILGKPSSVTTGGSSGSESLLGRTLLALGGIVVAVGLTTLVTLLRRQR
jgi:hypothetical protein